MIIEELNKFLITAKKPLVVILGPTASGKTALSVKIAQDFDGEIISTDSRQIYREMEIGTAKVTDKEMQGVPHHLLGIAAPDETVSLADYSKMALQKIDEIYARKHLPMLVGGTGLYISSIIDAYKVPQVPPNEKLRKKLEKEALEKGNDFVYKKLLKLDPQAAEKIHPNNLRYIIRAIEINLETGKNKSNQKDPTKGFDTFLIGIDWPRKTLYERINKRAELQIKNGLIEEVKKLLSKKYDPDLPSMSSLGVKEIIPCIEGPVPLKDCLDVLKQGTRRYAKRQMTWFRKYDNVHWLKPKELTEIINS